MTIREHDNFVKEDEKKYIINKNKDFLSYIKKILKEGYEPFVNIDELQELIDFITIWYEMKYPENELDFFNGYFHLDFKEIRSISKYMNFKQLRYRLDRKLGDLIECSYRSSIWGAYPNMGVKIITEEDKKDDWFTLIYANYKTGVIDNYSLSKLNIISISDFKEEEKTLDHLYIKLKSVIQDLSLNYDISELKRVVDNHNYDLELRKKVLELVPLSLVYSKNTIPEYGYIRAKRFIGEFNKHINVNLDTKQIDDIMSRNYDYDPNTKQIDDVKSRNYGYDSKKGFMKKIFKKSKKNI